MKNINDVKIESCSSADLVAYLYDELNAAGRTAFETHLANCGSCADEFAELSFARLDVYEWHRDEFASMETPRFVIPYAETESSVSWFDALRGFFASNLEWATAGGAFALMAVVFGAVFISSMDKSDEVAKADRPDNRAINRKQSEVGSTKRSAVETKTPIGPEKAEDEPELVQTSTDRKTIKPVKAVNRRSPAKSERPASQPVRPQRAKAPRLNDFEDEDDNTLRLGDLLADMDTRK